MASVNLSIREWAIIIKAVDYLKTYINVKVDESPVTPLEYNYIQYVVTNASIYDEGRIRDESEVNPKFFTLNELSEEVNPQFIEHRTKYGLPYTGPDRRKN